MKNRKDKEMERILARRRNNNVCTLSRATTLKMVENEAIRRCCEDAYWGLYACDRLVYMGVNADLGICVPDELEVGQVALSHVLQNGEVIEFPRKDSK
jgi:hypothetical protein